MKKILVTGGAGYIGSYTVLELLSAGYEPVIVDNFSNTKPVILERLKKISGRDIIFHEGDCVNLEFLETVFKTEKDIFGVIHFAALKAVGESIET